MKYPLKDILANFEISLIRNFLTLPIYKQEINPQIIESLRRRIIDPLSKTSLNNETARREILVAPIVLEVRNLIDATLEIEYPIEVNQYLKGDVDYLVTSEYNCIIIEAKKEDLESGLKQLAMQLVALSLWLNSNNPLYYGAVTTGTIWQFGYFDKIENIFYQDLKLYTIPDDLEKIMRIILRILVNSEIETTLVINHE